MPAPAVIPAQKRSEKIVAFKKLVVELRTRKNLLVEESTVIGVYSLISCFYDKITS